MRKTIVVSAAVVAVVGIGISPSLAATKSVRATASDRWSPARITVAAGDKIRFTWNTGSAHNVRKVAGTGGRMTRHALSERGSATFTVPARARRGATFRFVCDPHAPTMRVTATVR